MSQEQIYSKGKVMMLHNELRKIAMLLDKLKKCVYNAFD